MHPSALNFGKLFFETYCTDLEGAVVYDVGAQNVNGSLRDVCLPHLGYVGVDFVAGNGVDIVLDDPYRLPFADASLDVIVCSSCIEHSQFFWLIFLEMLRVLKPQGLLYLNVPSNGSFHRYPVDCWRFYPDAGRALEAWAEREGYPSMLLESFVGARSADSFESGGAWHDFVAVFIKDRRFEPLFKGRMVDRMDDYFNGYSSPAGGDLHPGFLSPDHLAIIERERQVSDRDVRVASLSQGVTERDVQIARLNELVTERDAQIASLDDVLTERAAQIVKLSDERDREIYATQQRLNEIMHSRSWRLTAPFRKLLMATKAVAGTRVYSRVENVQAPVAIQQENTGLQAGIDGEVEAIRKSGLFDEAFYLAAYPDIRPTPSDPIRHYCAVGWREGKNPSKDFDTRYYLATYSDIRNGGINPFWHYVIAGASELRYAAPGPSEPPAVRHVKAACDNDPSEACESPVAIQQENTGLQAEIDGEVEAIRESGLFDEAFYLAAYPDIRPTPSDPIRHYCAVGWREGKNPSKDFDTRYYLATYSDIRNGGINPFWHYVIAGASELRHSAPGQAEHPGKKRKVPKEVIDAEVDAIRKSGHFDEFFYISMYPDLPPPPSDLIRHYCEIGWREGRNPSDDFDTNSYLAAYTDIRDAGINPFWHYVVAGASELRHADPASATRYENDIWFGAVETDIKLLAFYTSPDWALLRGGRPISNGNSQPLLPHDELGFYDPSDWRVLQKQAHMAKRHGLYGFCFCLSCGEGGAISSQPLDLFLAHDDIDFRFCVQVEMHSERLAEPLVASVMRALADRRCVHVEGRSVILVTMADDGKDAGQAVDMLRHQLADAGVSNIFLIGCWARASKETPPACLADQCDAILDMPSSPVPGETGSYPVLDKNGVDAVPYSVVASEGVARVQNPPSLKAPLFNAVTLGRDNAAKKPRRPLVYSRFHVKHYRRWLDAAITGARSGAPEDRRFVFVNAWNDWSEGLVLEPDRQGGFGRVNETTRALLGIASGATMPKVSVIVPNYNHERFLRRRLESIYRQTYRNIEVILLDDCSSDQSRLLLDHYAAEYPEITRTLYNDVNSGGAFRQWAKGIKEATGDLVWIAESDDFCDERFLEVLVRCFDDEAVLLAYAKSAFVDPNEVPLQDDLQQYLSDLPCAGKWNAPYVETAHNEVRNALGIKNTIPNASGVLFKRPIDMALLDDESWLSMVVAGDWVFYLHILRGGKIAYSTDATNFFRRYKGSAAETTYKREVFYRELGVASRTVQELYDVSLAVVEKCQKSSKTLYDYHLGRSDAEFLRWYDVDSILRAREKRLPNVMVSTMGFYPGGAEIFPIRLVNEFKRQGLSVLLLSAGLNPREDGVRRMLRNDLPLVETSDVEAVKAIIHDFGVEVLNTHQWHIQKYPLQVPDVFDELCAHVASLHGMIEHGNAFAVTREQLRKTDEHVTTWVYTAEKNLAPFVSFGIYEKPSAKFVKMPNGMTPPSIEPIPRAHMNIPEDAFVLCCVSRAIPDKGWAEAIMAVERARELSGRDIRLILVGNGPVYDEYCRVGAPEFVYLAGFSQNSVGHYAAADMGIMLTKFKSESFPLTIVDCLFAGRPYIASDVGDIRNMLTTADNVAGEVIGLEDWEVAIERAAQVIAAFASDKQKYLSAQALVQDIAKRYRIDVVASQYVRLFDSRCDKHRGS
jgi:glycosyltransferase involved in cell wall biosynthesis/SAM-dependent methyltransferase